MPQSHKVYPNSSESRQDNLHHEYDHLCELNISPWNEILEQHIVVNLGDDLCSINNLTIPSGPQMRTLCGSSSPNANKKDCLSTEG